MCSTRYEPQIIDVGGRMLSVRSNAVASPLSGAPLIVAIHGGGFTSAYFDVEGSSLLERAGALGIPVIAIDRPGYGDTQYDGAAGLSIAGSLEFLDHATGAIWNTHGAGLAGLVLIGHSIGGAIALTIAARHSTWPLVGVAVSGVGLTPLPGDVEAWAALPPITFIDLPPEIRDPKLFGHSGSYHPSAPGLARAASAPALRQELVDVVTEWPRAASATLSKIDVPVQYRQGADDNLWTVSTAEVARFASYCSSAPWIDAKLIIGAGHCIDYHNVGTAFQLEQLAFALKCAARSQAES